MPFIQPTVGHYVWYAPLPEEAGEFEFSDETRLAAQISWVHSNGLVNLMVLAPTGRTFDRSLVHLRNIDDPDPGSRPFCEWMPSQEAVARGEIPAALRTLADGLTCG